MVFLVVNLTCALLVRTASADAQTIVLVRVAINDTLFVLCAVSLSLCLYKIAKMSLANIYLESKVREPVLMVSSTELLECKDIFLVKNECVKSNKIQKVLLRWQSKETRVIAKLILQEAVPGWSVTTACLRSDVFPSHNSVQGTSVCQVTVIGAMVILLYISRACYNLVVLALASIKRINSFDYDWYNVSDQVPPGYVW